MLVLMMNIKESLYRSCLTRRHDFVQVPPACQLNSSNVRVHATDRGRKLWITECICREYSYSISNRGSRVSLERFWHRCGNSVLALAWWLAPGRGVFYRASWVANKSIRCMVNRHRYKILVHCRFFLKIKYYIISRLI